MPPPHHARARSAPPEELRLRKEELEDNPTARVPICLALDISESMSRGRKMAELNAGIDAFYQAVRDDELASITAEIAIVTFGGKVKVAQDFAGIARQRVPRLEPDGETPMGEAVMTALDLLEDAKGEYSALGVDYFQPWLVLMTDGQPTDEIEGAVDRCRRLLTCRPQKLTVFPVAIGRDADLDTLGRFAPHVGPLRIGVDFARFFAWLAMSIQQVSLANPGDSAAASIGEQEFERLRASWDEVMRR